MAVNSRSNTVNIDTSKFNRNGDELDTKVCPSAEDNRDKKDDTDKRTEPNRKVIKSISFKQALEDAKAKGKPKMLFGQLWWKNELVVVFATTNVGKTVLAMQIADALSKGDSVFDDLKNECGKLKVSYLDWELSAMQIINRYSDENGNLYDFSENLTRIEKNYDFDYKKGDSYEEYLTDDIESHVEEHEPQVLIIDNLSVLRSGTESAKEALPLMHFLNNLKVKYNLSIMVVGHTPKKDVFTPINMNHLQGSAQISNALDGCFAIGICQDQKQRYIIELKQRNAEITAHADNVIICDLRKDFNFLKFEYIGRNSEQSQLMDLNEEAKIRIEKTIIDNKDKPVREIAHLVAYGKTKVADTINQYKEDPKYFEGRFESLPKEEEKQELSAKSVESAMDSADGQSTNQIPF